MGGACDREWVDCPGGQGTAGPEAGNRRLFLGRFGRGATGDWARGGSKWWSTEAAGRHQSGADGAETRVPARAPGERYKLFCGWKLYLFWSSEEREAGPKQNAMVPLWAGAGNWRSRRRKELRQGEDPGRPGPGAWHRIASGDDLRRTEGLADSLGRLDGTDPGVRKPPRDFRPALLCAGRQPSR